MRIARRGSQDWSGLLEMAVTAEQTPRKHRLTVSDYHRMGEMGILAPGAQVQLIKGEIINLAPIGSRHSAIVELLNQIAEAADTSLTYDRELKLPLYARHGISEAWFIDIESRKFQRYVNPNNGR
jgi:hypothetical protein